jgi:hypothetical protein
MRTEQSTPLLQHSGLELLYALSFRRDAVRQRAIVDAGASEAAVVAMRSHVSSQQLQDAGCVCWGSRVDVWLVMAPLSLMASWMSSWLLCARMFFVRGTPRMLIQHTTRRTTL